MNQCGELLIAGSCGAAEGDEQRLIDVIHSEPPATSLPLLWLVALQRGGAFTASMTTAILIGSISEGFVLWAYAKMTTRCTPMVALLGALGVFALTVTTIGTFHFSAL